MGGWLPPETDRSKETKKENKQNGQINTKNWR